MPNPEARGTPFTYAFRLRMNRTTPADTTHHDHLVGRLIFTSSKGIRTGNWR